MIDTIESAVCAYLDIAPHQLRRRRKMRELVRARWHVWYLLRHRHELTLSDIGRRYEVDHSTVLHGVQQMERMIRESLAVRVTCEGIGRLLDGGAKA